MSYLITTLFDQCGSCGKRRLCLVEVDCAVATYRCGSCEGLPYSHLSDYELEAEIDIVEMGVPMNLQLTSQQMADYAVIKQALRDELNRRREGI